MYDASNFGRIRSRKGKGRILKTVTNQGYEQIAFYGKTRKVHSLVTEAFLGPRPEGLVVRHLDGDHSNNNIDNLRYGTHAENVADMIRHGAWRPRGKKGIVNRRYRKSRTEGQVEDRSQQ